MGKKKKSGKKGKSSKGAVDAPAAAVSEELPVVEGELIESLPVETELLAAPTQPTPAPPAAEDVAQTAFIQAPQIAALAPTAEASVSTFRPGSLWKRIFAATYDFIFLLIVGGLIIGGIIGWLLYTFAQPISENADQSFVLQETPRMLIYGVCAFIVVLWFYFTILECSIGATIGKLIFNLRVTDLAGKRIGFFRANLRLMATFISALSLGIGFLRGFLKKDRQTLQDALSKTRVVKVI